MGSEMCIRDSCPLKSVKDYARRQLVGGTPAVHVLHDIVEQFENRGWDAEDDDHVNEEHDTRYIDGQPSELEPFDALDESNNGDDAAAETYYAQFMDHTAATHYINGTMNEQSNI